MTQSKPDQMLDALTLVERLLWLERKYSDAGRIIAVDFKEAAATITAALDRAEKAEAACKEWADVSQANYQRAKNAEAEVERLRIALANIDVGEGWAALIARAALEEQK